jgi:NAD(P)H-hydrate epimerase
MRVVSVGQMRSIDSNAINNFGISGVVLMEMLPWQWSGEIQHMLTSDNKKSLRGQKPLFCRKRNNGGDGLAIAGI